MIKAKRSSKLTYKQRLKFVEDPNDRDRWKRAPKKLVSVPTDAYRNGWDRVFKKSQRQRKRISAMDNLPAEIERLTAVRRTRCLTKAELARLAEANRLLLGLRMRAVEE